MCTRHSFLLDKQGRIYDGMGLTHSHTEIASMHGIKSADHDKLNAYEWQPPEGWPEAEVIDGLTVDRQNFAPKASHDKAIESYLRKRFPDMAAWDAPETIDSSLDGQTITLGGESILVLLSGEHHNPPYCIAGGDVVVLLADNATMQDACDNSTVTLADNATMRYAYDNSTVTLADNATMRYACGNSTVIDNRKGGA